ncbi:MAG: hypothetical protein AB7H93_00890 [Vicinamibacterales bacterium]
MRTHNLMAGTLAVLTGIGAAEARAQVLGQFRWQLQPYCNVLTVTVTQAGAAFTLDGTDDQCGALPPTSTYGTAHVNPNGSIGIGLTTVLAVPVRVVHTNALIGLASLGGAWRDTAGNAGTFVFTPGAPIPGPARPVPAGGLAAGIVSDQALADGAVTPGKIAADAVSDTAQIKANTIELSDVKQVYLGSSSQSLPLAAMACTFREHTTLAATVGLGDLLIAVPITVPAGVHTVPMVAGANGRFGMMFCNTTAAAIPTSQFSAHLYRVPR